MGKNIDTHNGARTDIGRCRAFPDPVGRHLWGIVADCANRRKSRRQLGRLSRQHRRDIGLTDAEAEQEAARPVWQR